jgi:hypothetical protein
MRPEIEAQPEDLVPIGDAAHAAGVATSTVYRWREAGLLTLYKRRSRTLIRRSDLEQLLRPTEALPGGRAPVRLRRGAHR